MNGNPDVIEILNEVLTAELTAINQYFIDAKMLQNWGYDGLGGKFRHESIDEMHDAEALIERILYLDGIPNLQRLGSVRVGESVTEKLQLALQVEVEAVERLTRGIELCTDRHDHGSRDLLQKILAGEEAHADWLEAQLSLIEQLGAELYQAQQISTAG